MPDKGIPTRKVEKSAYRNYWKKAEEFSDAMHQCVSMENWDAASLNAIHASISANDALLVYFHGMRSTSEKHDDAVRLLLSLVKHEEVKTAATHLRRLISSKGLAEYEGRLLTASEAHALVKHAERFMEWVQSMLP